MSRFFSFLLLLVVLVICIGFFRGWLSMSTTKEPFSEKMDLHLRVDPDKMKQDANTVEGKTKSLFSAADGDSKFPK